MKKKRIKTDWLIGITILLMSHISMAEVLESRAEHEAKIKNSAPRSSPQPKTQKNKPPRANTPITVPLTPDKRKDLLEHLPLPSKEQLEKLLGAEIIDFLKSADSALKFEIYPQALTENELKNYKANKRSKAKVLESYLIERDGIELEKDQLELSRALFLAPETYLYEGYSKCLFQPTLSIIFKNAEFKSEGIIVLIDLVCPFFEIHFKDKVIRSNFSPLQKNWIQTLQHIYPDNPSIMDYVPQEGSQL